MKSKSYKPCDCDADCCLLDTNQNEPCWGKVEVTTIETIGDDDEIYIHHCQGHINKGMSVDRSYILEPL